TSRPSTARSTSQPFCSSLSRYIWAIRSSSSTKRTRRVADTYLTVEVFGLTAQQPGQRRGHRSRQLAVGGGAELLPLQHRQQRVEGGVDRRVAVGLRDRQPGFAVGDPEDLLLRLAPLGVVLGPLLRPGPDLVLGVAGVPPGVDDSFEAGRSEQPQVLQQALDVVPHPCPPYRGSSR